jgi:hypothetical protein
LYQNKKRPCSLEFDAVGADERGYGKAIVGTDHEIGILTRTAIGFVQRFVRRTAFI